MSGPASANRASVGGTILAGFLIALIGIVLIVVGVWLGDGAFAVLVPIGLVLLGGAMVVEVVALVVALRRRAARRTPGV